MAARIAEIDSAFRSIFDGRYKSTRLAQDRATLEELMSFLNESKNRLQDSIISCDAERLVAIQAQLQTIQSVVDLLDNEVNKDI